MSVIKNLMVRVGANASGYVKGMKDASASGKSFQKTSKNIKEALKGYESPFKAAARASAAYKEQMQAATRANAAAKERFATVSEELKKSKAVFSAVKTAAEGLNLKKSFADQRAGIEAELEAVNAKLGTLSAGMKKPSGSGLVQLDDGALMSLSEAQKLFSELTAQSDALAGRLIQLDGVAGMLGDSFQESTIGQAVKSVTADVDKLGAEAAAAKRDMENMSARAAKSMSGLSPGAVGAAAGIRQVKDNIKALLSAAGKGLGGKISSMFKNIGKSANSGCGGVKNMLASIKRLGVVSLGLRVASGLFGKMRSVISSYVQENDALNATVSTMKSQLGQALAPAINLVIGLLQKLMPLVNGISSAIGQVVSSVFGGIKAEAKAASAAVAAAGELYGFDQITKAEDSGGSGSGMAAVSNEGAGMFSGIATKVSAEINKLKALFTAGDWGGIGQTFAGYLNGIVDSVNGLNLGQRISTAMSAVAESINGFVDGLDWGNLGSLMIGGFNTVVQSLSNFIGGIDWYSMMSSIVTGLTSMVTGIDWKSIGTLLNNSVTGLLDAVIALVTETDWGGLIDSVITGLCTLIETIDWGGILLRIGKALVGIVGQIPSIIGSAIGGIYGIIGSIFEALGLSGVADLYKGISSTLKNLGRIMTSTFKEITEKPTAFFSIMWKGIKACINEILRGVERMVNGIIRGINKMIDGWNGIAGLASSLGINLTVRKVSEIALPRLAEGGIAIRPVTAEIGEAGREAVLPLERNTGWAKEVAALINGNGTGGTPMVLQVYIGNKMVHEGTVDYINGITQATGRCPIYV